MTGRVFGNVISVVERKEGDFLSQAASTSDTTLYLDDATPFDEDGGQARVNDPDEATTELVTYTAADHELNTLTLDPALVNDYAVDTPVYVYPSIKVRVAYVDADSAEDDTVPAIVPSQIGWLLPLGTRDDTAQERVTLEYEPEGTRWVVRDIYIKIGDGTVLTVYYNEHSRIHRILSEDDHEDVVDSTPTDQDVLTWDDYLQAWIAQAPPSGGSTVDVEDDGSPVGTFDTLDFGTNLDVTDNGDGSATIDGTAGATAPSFVSVKKWGFVNG